MNAMNPAAAAQGAGAKPHGSAGARRGPRHHRRKDSCVSVRVVGHSVRGMIQRHHARDVAVFATTRGGPTARTPPGRPSRQRVVDTIGRHRADVAGGRRSFAASLGGGRARVGPNAAGRFFGDVGRGGLTKASRRPRRGGLCPVNVIDHPRKSSIGEGSMDGEYTDAYWAEQAQELENALNAGGNLLEMAEMTETVTYKATVHDEWEEQVQELENALNADDAEKKTAEVPEEGWEGLGYKALFAQIAVLGLPALVNSCIEPVLSSAETACAAKIGTLYLAALAPSSSLFAFAAEMCFAVSVVVTTAISKVSARTSTALAAGVNTSTSGGEEVRAAAEADGELPRTITAAVTASFVSGGVLAGCFALLAAPLLRLMNVPAEVASLVQLYVCVRALGLPFFAASNAAEGVFVGQRDGMTPMVAWTCTGAATLVMLLSAAHPSALGLGLPGAAAAIAAGQVLTALVFFRGLAKKGWLQWPTPIADADPSPAEGGNGSSASGLAGFTSICCEAVDVLVSSRMVNEIGWMFLGAISRMGTYAAVTASASALGVIPGATHKVALEIYWLLSFLTEPIFTAGNALLPRELAAGRKKSARRLRNSLLTVTVVLSTALAFAGGLMTNLGVYSDDPLVTAALSELILPVATTLGLAATAYGVEGTIIGAGEVGYLGRTHARDFLVVLVLLKVNEYVTAGGGGLSGIWWVLAGFQGLRIVQHWVHLAVKRPFQDDVVETAAGKVPALA